MPRDVGIIGGGPAGITAAIQLSRMGHNPILFERRILGGLLNNANIIENYPGFPQGISGNELVGLFRSQLARFQVESITTTVTSVTRKDRLFLVRTICGDHTFRSVVVATGTYPLRLEVPGENELIDSHIFYEVTDLEGNPIQGKDIFIVGGGDAAFDYALNLEGRGANISIAFRSPTPACLRLLHLRAMDKSRIHILPSTDIDSFQLEGDKVLNKVIGPQEHIEVPSDYTMIAVGREPNSDILPNETPLTFSPIPGLYLVGDLTRGGFRQVGIAVGDGLLAAMHSDRYLRGDNER